MSLFASLTLFLRNDIRVWVSCVALGEEYGEYSMVWYGMVQESRQGRGV